MDGGALLASGFAMGLAGSLHCSCVCGGIASSLLLAARPGVSTPLSHVSALAAIQGGRALTYALGGAVVASAGSSLAGVLHLAGLQDVARLAAALVIVAVGLATAGVLPQRYISGFANAASNRIRRAIPYRAAVNVPFLSGVAWGLAPCGMVYNALVMATVAGSPINGALLMSGFALATIPAVSAVAFGSAHAATRGLTMPSRLRLKWVLGAFIVAFGVASGIASLHSAPVICLSN